MYKRTAMLGLVAALFTAPAFAGHDDNETVDAAIGGGLGGAAGAAIGNEVGGRNGAILGGALGAAGGAAVTTDDKGGHHRGGHGPFRNDFCPPGQAKKGRC